MANGHGSNEIALTYEPREDAGTWAPVASRVIMKGSEGLQGFGQALKEVESAFERAFRINVYTQDSYHALIECHSKINSLGSSGGVETDPKRTYSFDYTHPESGVILRKTSWIGVPASVASPAQILVATHQYSDANVVESEAAYHERLFKALSDDRRACTCVASRQTKKASRD